MPSVFKAETFVSKSNHPTSLSNKKKVFHLILLEKGRICITVNEREYTCYSPCVICLNENQSFEIVSEDFILKVVSFLPDFINRNMTISNMQNKNYNDFCNLHDFLKLTPFINHDFENSCISDLSPELAGFMSALINACVKQYEQKPDWYWSCRMRSYFLDCINIIERLYYQEFGGDDRTNLDFFIPEGMPELRKALDLIRNYYSNPELNATTIVQKLHTNKNLLNEEFKQVTNKTVYQYLLEYRLFQAVRKLKFTALSIEEISYSCGFNNASTFSTIFKIKKGMAPNAYREKALHNRKEFFHNQ